MRILREWVVRLWASLVGRRGDRDLEEELQLHLELAADEARRRGHTPQQAERIARWQAGGTTQTIDALRDQRGLPWLDALMSDVVLGWRQMRKHRAASAAAILSLGLALGATTAAFRLVDAVLLRPLPIAEPERLFFLTASVVHRPDYQDEFDYPTFRRYSAAVGDRADLMVVSWSSRQPVVIGTSQEPERVYRQYVSGNVFGIFGLQPALGRLLSPSDDVTPGAHPVAVISHDFWARRFGADPAVIGTTVRRGGQRFEIVGVAPKGFIGTEPGAVTDVFLPAMMNTEAINSPGWTWFRMWVRPARGTSPQQVEQILQAVFANEHQAHAQAFPSDMPKERIDAYLGERLQLLPAASGTSGTQKIYRRPLLILITLVALVLLIAIVNVANLLTAQAMARGREMALRISIGAGRWRLIQLLLVESALLSLCASAVGIVVGWWSAPLVVSMLAPPEEPVRLILDADWRAITFGVGLTAIVPLLFGLAPALRASAVKPVAALKDSDHAHAHRRLMHALMGAQMAFCVFVLFVAGLLVLTFNRLQNQPLGFSHDRVIVVQTQTRGAQPPAAWAQVADHLARTAGVESAAFAGWTLLSGNGWTIDVRLPGGAIEARSPYALDVSPGFFETMGIALIDGRDFRPGDLAPRSPAQGGSATGVAVVNEAFARMYFDGQNPVGRWVTVHVDERTESRIDIIGWVRDATYRDVRETIRPTVYVPVTVRNEGSFIVRAATDPAGVAPIVRTEIGRARPEFLPRIVELQTALVERQMIRERLLATLSFFFAVVALLLAGIGVYGVLNYAVLQQRRDIGVRMALGARAAHVAGRVTFSMAGIVAGGAVIGIAAGMAGARLLEGVLFQIEPTEVIALVTPIAVMFATAALAALPPVMRAVRIDPATTLRAE